MSSSKLQYTKAVVRKISNHFAEDSVKLAEPDEAIDLAKAKAQWSSYVKVLKDLGLEVTIVEADDKFPDCVFIEDPAVVCDGTALITLSGHVSRRGEGVAVKNALKKLGM